MAEELTPHQRWRLALSNAINTMSNTMSNTMNTIPQALLSEQSFAGIYPTRSPSLGPHQTDPLPPSSTRAYTVSGGENPLSGVGVAAATHRKRGR